MTIHISKDTENAITAAVQSGQFASADEMVTGWCRNTPSVAGRRPSR